MVGRTAGESGDTLIALLNPNSATYASDIDLQSIITETYDRFPLVIEAHLLDGSDAADLASREGPGAVVLSSMADHHLARPGDDFQVVCLGRSEGYGTTTFGP